jgi:hypothetical protein
LCTIAASLFMNFVVKDHKKMRDTNPRNNDYIEVKGSKSPNLLKRVLWNLFQR